MFTRRYCTFCGVNIVMIFFSALEDSTFLFGMACACAKKHHFEGAALPAAEERRLSSVTLPETNIYRP